MAFALLCQFVIKLVYLYSKIKMTHGPIRIRFI